MSRRRSASPAGSVVFFASTSAGSMSGPATGFNDRMADDPGPWFDRKRAAPEDVAVMDQLVQRITVGQMDPAEVVKRYVELVEAASTELVNFVPPDIVERMSKSTPAR